MPVTYLTKTCSWCKTEFSYPLDGVKSRERRFCSGTCRSKNTGSKPENKQRIADAGRFIRGPQMLMNNPMKNPATRQKMAASLKGRPFPTKRGGNGKSMSIPQIMLWLTIPELEAELSVTTTKQVRDLLHTPNHYKLDLAFPAIRLAIEVDGYSHNTLAVKEKDQRKDLALKNLGWYVLRFSNQMILREWESTISKLRTTITILQMMC